MKTPLLVLLILFGQILSAQSFTEVPQATPFQGVMSSAIAFSDIDGDGDEDVLITGEYGPFPSIPVAIFYTNDGEGNFTEMTSTPIEGLRGISIAFADIDGDGDSDVLVSGRANFQVDYITKLYTNDGAGNFTEMADTPFVGLAYGSVAFSDIDADGDLDLLITGTPDIPPAPTTRLYTNNGNGEYTEMADTPFVDVYNSSIAFNDVNDDGTPDLLITGESGGLNSQYVSILYSNDGTGNYTEVMDTPFDGVSNSSIAFADIDGDLDQDVLIIGRGDSTETSTELYTNDGLGNFSVVSASTFEDVFRGSVAFSDVDGDGDPDVLITGRATEQYEPFSKMYTNDGTGTFTEDQSNTFENVRGGSIAFSDVNGDGDPDVLVTGDNGTTAISKMYSNNGAGIFTEWIGTSFEKVQNGSMAFSDVDGDGDPDIILTGMNNSSDAFSKLYQNDGTYTFSESQNSILEGVWFSSIAFADINGNGSEEVLITGVNNSVNAVSKLYANNTAGLFTEIEGTTFENVWFSSVAFSDVDNDEDLDVLISGRTDSESQISKLYANDGAGNYTLIEGTPFESVERGSVAFSDIDGDGDQDVLITGLNSTESPISRLYTNDGTGNFTEEVGVPFVGVSLSSIAFSDVDGDGDSDVLITGQDNLDVQVARLYINDGTGNYTEVTDTPFDGISFGSVVFFDADVDGDQDVIISGLGESGSISKLYMNDGTGNFTELLGTPFEGVNGSSVAISDIESDGDLDVLITGLNDSGIRIAKLYTNNGTVSSLNEVSQKPHFDFAPHPNPASTDKISVSFVSESGNQLTVSVFDLDGRLLKQKEKQIGTGHQIISIDVSSFDKGTYIILLDNGHKKGTKKIVVL